ncbi:MAG: transcriptional regulator, partial [bacterium (Candidatus Stahlbacteria) CG23_combo_of_CG06-09_8_20_14_all_40_9]
MKKYKIFVSGVQKELAIERQAVKELISENILLREHFSVFLFEDLPAKSKPASKTYLGEVDKSDIYIGIFGNRYGSVGSHGVSATEREFRQAQKQGKEILTYVKGWSESKRDKKLKKLIKEIEKSETGYIYKQFNEIPELKTHIFESLVTFLKERGVISKTVFDMSVCEGATYDDIDEEKVSWFLRTAKIIRKYPLGENTPLKEAFVHLNLLKDDRLTNAAVLLFGKNPQKFHLQAEVKCLHFHGTEIEKPFKSYHIYKGNLFEQIDKALGFALDTLILPVIRQPGTVAVKRPYEIPEFVIQEAIVNAVAHRDYYSSAGVQAMVFIDRIEIWNPGQLPPQLT